MRSIKISFLLIILVLWIPANVTYAKATKSQADESFANGDYAKAVDLYAELLAKDPSDILYLSIGHAYYKLENFQEAVNAYTAAVEIQKKMPQAQTLRCLAKAQYSLQQYAEALDSYRQAVSIGPEPSDAFQMALCYTNLNLWSQARRAILEYLEDFPLAAPALELLAHIQFNSSNPQEAVAIFHYIVNANPSNQYYLAGLANALIVTERHGEAIDILEYTLRAVDSDNLVTMQTLADLYTNRQMYSQAVNLYRQIVTSKPSPSDEDYCRLGYAAMQSGQTATAQDAFHRALEISPNHYYSHLCLGRIALDQFEFDKAQQHYLSAASANPASPEPHIFIANMQTNLKNHSLAARHYEEAIMLGSVSPQLYYNCTLALLNAEDYSQAREVLKRAIAEYPDHSDLNKLLERTVTISATTEAGT